MANLDQIASLMNVEMNVTDNKNKLLNKKATGQKRRAWLDVTTNPSHTKLSQEEQSYESHTSLAKKGSINTVYKPDLSAPFIPSINSSSLNKGQTEKLDGFLSLSLKNLRGNPLKIVQYLYKIVSTEEKNITKKVTQSELVIALQISKDSVRTALRFLLKNKLITRVELQVGKHGWSKYLIKNSLLIEIGNNLRKENL